MVMVVGVGDLFGELVGDLLEELAGDTELEVEGETQSAVWVVESVSDK